jgi:exodeoxyribonuclease VII large subunit
VEELGRLLQGYSYQATLERGFAVVYADGQVATRAKEIAAGQHLDIAFADDTVRATAGDGAAPSASGPPASGDLGQDTGKPAASRRQAPKKTARPRGTPKDDGGQGSLL